MEPAGASPTFVVGIRQHIGETNQVQEGGMVLSAAPEIIRNPDDLEKVQPDMTVAYAGTALIVPGRYQPRYQFSEPNGGNHLMVAPMTADRQFDYLLAAGWSEGQTRKTVPEFEAYVRQTAREYEAPVVFAGASEQTR